MNPVFRRMFQPWRAFWRFMRRLNSLQNKNRRALGYKKQRCRGSALLPILANVFNGQRKRS